MTQYHLGLGQVDYQKRGLLRRISELFFKPRRALLPNQYLLGIDIWEGQGVINWKALEDGGVKVAFVRLNNISGGHHMDANFTTNWNAPTTIIKIPYFVYNPWVNGQANYDWLVSHMPASAKGVAADVEVIYNGYSKDTYAQQVEKFKDLAKVRYNIAIYTAEWFLPYLSYWVKDVPYWWAQYPSALYQSMTITWDRMRELLQPFSGPMNAAKCPGRIIAWQCSGDKIILPGSSRVIDVNVLFMTLDEVKQFAGVTVTPTPNDSEWLELLQSIKQDIAQEAGAILDLSQRIAAVKLDTQAILQKVNSTPAPDPIVSDGYTGPDMGVYKIIEAPDQQTGNALTVIQDSYGNEITIVMDKMVAWMEANCPGWSNFVSNGSVTKGADGFWRYEVKLLKGQLVRIAEVGGKTTANPLGNGRIVGMDSEGSPLRGVINMDAVSPTKTPYYFHKVTGQPWWFPIIQPRQQPQMTVLNAWWIPMRWLEKVA